FFTSTPPTETSPLSLHDALPISSAWPARTSRPAARLFSRQHGAGRGRPLGPAHRHFNRPDRAVHDSRRRGLGGRGGPRFHVAGRSEEHTSELQSRENLVCRLLLE